MPRLVRVRGGLPERTYVLNPEFVTFVEQDGPDRAVVHFQNAKVHVRMPLLELREKLEGNPYE